MPKGKMRKAFYDNMLEFGITKEDLEKNFLRPPGPLRDL